MNKSSTLIYISSIVVFVLTLIVSTRLERSEQTIKTLRIELEQCRSTDSKQSKLILIPLNIEKDDDLNPYN